MSEAALARAEPQEIDRYYEVVESSRPARIYERKFNPRALSDIEDHSDYDALLDELSRFTEMMLRQAAAEEGISKRKITDTPNDNLPIQIHNEVTYPLWLKVVSFVTLVVLIVGFVGGTIWHGSFLLIGVPIGFTLWWIVARSASHIRAAV